MKIILFGATGMVGQGVLRECLLDPGVSDVLSIGRSKTGQTNPKLREIVRTNFYDFFDIAQDLSGYDACFFCLGITSIGMSEENYRRVTYDVTMAAARLLVTLNPGMSYNAYSASVTDQYDNSVSNVAINLNASTTYTAPVVNEHSAEAQNAASEAISSTSTKRPRGIFESM